MLFNTSNINKEYTKQNIQTLGKSFSFFEKIKMGSIGSSKLIIRELSSNLKPRNLHTSYNGKLVHLCRV